METLVIETPANEVNLILVKPTTTPKWTMFAGDFAKFAVANGYDGPTRDTFFPEYIGAFHNVIEWTLKNKSNFKVKFEGNLDAPELWREARTQPKEPSAAYKKGVKSMVMKRAWAIRRECAKSCGCKVGDVSMSISMKMAWSEQKANLIKIAA